MNKYLYINLTFENDKFFLQEWKKENIDLCDALSVPFSLVCLLGFVCLLQHFVLTHCWEHCIRTSL